VNYPVVVVQFLRHRGGPGFIQVGQRTREGQQMLDAIRPFLMDEEKFTLLRQLIFHRGQSAA